MYITLCIGFRKFVCLTWNIMVSYRLLRIEKVFEQNLNFMCHIIFFLLIKEGYTKLLCICLRYKNIWPHGESQLIPCFYLVSFLLWFLIALSRSILKFSWRNVPLCPQIQIKAAVAILRNTRGLPPPEDFQRHQPFVDLFEFLQYAFGFQVLFRNLLSVL